METRRQKQALQSPTEAARPSGNPRQKKRTRRGDQLINDCLEYGFEAKFCCSGCQLFYNSIPIEKLGKMPTLLEKRFFTHTAEKYVCRQPWKKELEDAENDAEYMLIKAQHNLLESGKVDIGNLISKTKLLELSSSSSDTSDDGGGIKNQERGNPETTPERPTRQQPTAAVVESPITRKSKQDVALRDLECKSYGHTFTIKDVPVSHKVVPVIHFSRMLNAENKLRKLEKQFNQTRFGLKASGESKTLLTTALVSTPGLALKTAQHFIPLVVASFLMDSGVFDRKSFDISKFARAFPSEFYLRKLVFEQAAKASLSLGWKLRNQDVYLACDKGNKKGVGHFIKMLSWWDGASVQCHILDMDASQGDTDSCADAVRFSLQKVGGISKLRGTTTDHGGGGTLDKFAEKLRERGICNLQSKIIGCSIHAFQLTLSTPVIKVLGEGGLGSKNVMQLIHAVYDMQESLEFAEFVQVMEDSICLVKKLQASPKSDEFLFGDKSFDKEFGLKMRKVMSFYKDFAATKIGSVGNKKKTVNKMVAPVLTRWWYVGEGAAYVWEHYSVLLKATQTVINVYSSNTSKANKIASGLQPLLLEPELFSDLALLKCYHEAYFNQHLKWLQASTDLSNRPGFQAHQLVARYFLMLDDLRTIKSTVFTTHPLFEAFRDSLEILDTTVRDVQIKKANIFIDKAINALRKHMDRWGAAQLLPAVLLSEMPIAESVARVLLQMPPVVREPSSNTFFVSSAVHNRVFDMQRFDAFVKDIAEKNGTYHPLEIHAAREILSGLNIRNSTTTTKTEATDFMFRIYLPIASHTQMVESAVKEAKLVSTTGRHEPLRSAFAINRSHVVLGAGSLSSMSATQKVVALSEAARAFDDNLHTLRSELGEMDYAARLNSIRAAIDRDHFRGERIAKLKDRVTAKGSINKRANIVQRSHGVDRTAAVMGLIQYAMVRKNKGHEEPLKVELEFRGIPCTTITFVGLKKLLREDEVARVNMTVGATKQEKQAATKAFKRLSTAIFVGIDEIVVDDDEVAVDDED